MAQVSSSSSDDEMITGINVTPLVDVVLVLLVIMMVTATFIAAKGIPLELPKARTGESAPTASLAISIEPGGRLYLESKAVTKAELVAAVHEAQNRGVSQAMIAADGGTAHREVVQVIDLLREGGIAKFALNIDPEALSNPR